MICFEGFAEHTVIWEAVNFKRKNEHYATGKGHPREELRGIGAIENWLFFIV